MKVYNANSKKIVKEKLVAKKFKIVHGNNQMHVDYAEVLPCGQQRKLFVDDAKEDYHDTMFHDEECTGVEHFTTCKNPADPMMGVWSRRCTKRCPKLRDTINKVRKKISKYC